MSYTENKLNALRRLLLGPLFDDCKNNPYGVSRLRIEEHINNLKEDGCIGDCSVDDFVKMCQLKSHIPSCYNEKDRGCVEGWFGKQKGTSTVAFTNYKNAKYFEDDEDEDDEDEDDDEEKECGVCGLDEDLDDNYGTVAEGYRDEFKTLEKMSCGHYAHKACLVKVSKGLDKDNAFCPLCKVKFPITEVQMPILTKEQKRQNAMLKQIKDGLATGMSLKTIAEMNLTTISGLIRGLVMNVKTFGEAVGMSDEELENEMYSVGDELHPRVIKKYYEGGALEKEYEVKWDIDDEVNHGYYKKYYENGQLKMQNNYKNGVLDGETKRWYDNGQIASHSTTKDSVREGEYKSWWKNGQLETHSYYKDGKLNGEYRSYYDNGKMSYQGTYKDGNLDGEEKEWYENGRLNFQKNYKDGNLDGEEKEWDEDGILLIKNTYEDDKLIIRRIYKDGLLHKEHGPFTYTDTRKIGTVKYYNSDGKVVHQRNIDVSLDEDYDDEEEDGNDDDNEENNFSDDDYVNYDDN